MSKKRNKNKSNNKVSRAIKAIREDFTEDTVIGVLSKLNEREIQQLKAKLTKTEVEKIDGFMQEALEIMEHFMTGEIVEAIKNAESEEERQELLEMLDIFTDDEYTLEEDIEIVSELDSLSSSEKILELEDDNLIQVINKMLWTDEKIKCLKCGKEQYYRNDSYYEKKLKYYSFISYCCNDTIELGLNKSTNNVEDIR